MADELRQLEQDLRQVGDSASDTKARIDALEQSLQKLLAAEIEAGGGTVPSGGLRETSGQLLTGEMPTAGSINLGGVKIDLAKFDTRVKEISAQIQRIIIDTALLELQKGTSALAKAAEVQSDVSGAVAKGTVQTKAKATAQPIETAKADEVSFSQTVDTTKTALGELASSISRYARLIDSQATSTKLTPEQHIQVKEQALLSTPVNQLPPRIAELFEVEASNIRSQLASAQGQYLVPNPQDPSGKTKLRQSDNIPEWNELYYNQGMRDKKRMESALTKIVEGTDDRSRPSRYLDTAKGWTLQNLTEGQYPDPELLAYLGRGDDAARAVDTRIQEAGRQGRGYDITQDVSDPRLQEWLYTRMGEINQAMDLGQTVPPPSQPLPEVDFGAVSQKAAQEIERLAAAAQKASPALERVAETPAVEKLEQVIASVPQVDAASPPPPPPTKPPTTLADFPEGEEYDYTAIRAKIQELLKQKLGAIFDQLSPEQINKMVDSALAGIERVSAGSVGGQRIRPRLEQVAKSVEEDIAQVHALPPTLPGLPPPGRTWEGKSFVPPPKLLPSEVPQHPDDISRRAQEINNEVSNNLAETDQHLVRVINQIKSVPLLPAPKIAEKVQEINTEINKMLLLPAGIPQIPLAGGGGIMYPATLPDLPKPELSARELLRQQATQPVVQPAPAPTSALRLQDEFPTFTGGTQGARGVLVGYTPPRRPTVTGDVEKDAKELEEYTARLRAERERVREQLKQSLKRDADLLSSSADRIARDAGTGDFEQSVMDFSARPAGRQVQAGQRRPDISEQQIEQPAKGQLPEQFYGDRLKTAGIEPGAINQIKQLIGSLGTSFTALDTQIKTVDATTSRLSVTLLDKAGNALRQVGIEVKGATANFAGMSKGMSILDIKGLQEQEKYIQAFTQATRQGFQPTDLQKVTKFDTKAGYERMLFSRVDEQGVTQQLPLIIDKTGKAIVSTQKQFRTSVDAIVRDFKEVLRWSIAVAAIYAPMRKLSEAMQLAIENEAKLADIGIVLNKSHKDMSDVFTAAAQAARATGENIGGVLESYELAYKAAGRTGSEMERTAVANRLLADTLILSKMSGLGQAEALDILGGTLQQVGASLDSTTNPLMNGLQLLDKWIAVSKTANVDLGTLATAFSITAESAENAGLDIDKLNGVVGALSEKIGALGASQTGNAVRALVGGVYSPGAEAELGKYGISVRTNSGQMREWLDIMTEIKRLNEAGLISGDQLNKIALVLGQGVRRGQQYLSVLDDMDRVSELAKVSADAHGDAQEALAFKMDTVMTASTNMSTAFQQLAQAMGTEGGMLSTIRLAIELATVLTDVMTGLLTVTGKAGPTLTSAAAAYLLFFRASGSVGRMQENLGIRMYESSGLEKMDTAIGRQIPFGYTNNRIGERAAMTAGRYLPGFAMGLPGAFSHISEGEYAEAGASMGGAVIGTLLAGGNPIGGLIGTVIVDTLLQQLDKRKGDIESAFLRPIQDATQAQEDETPVEKRERLTQRATEIAFPTGFSRRLAQFDAFMSSLITPGKYNEEEKYSEGLTDFAFVRERMSKRVEQYEEFGTRIVSEEAYNEAKEFLSLLDEIEKDTPLKIVDVDVEKSSLAKIKDSIGQELLPEVRRIQEELRAGLRQDLFRGEIRPKQFSDAEEVIRGFPSALPKLYTAIYGEDEASPEEMKKRFEELGLVMSKVSSEEVQIIVRGADEIYGMTAALEAARAQGDLVVEWQVGAKLELIDTDDFEKQIEDQQRFITDSYESLLSETKLREFKAPTVIGLEDLGSLDDVRAVEARAKELQEQRYTAMLEWEVEGLDEEVIATQIERAEPILIKAGEQAGFYLAKGITESGFLTEAFKQMVDEGLITTQKMGYQFLDFTQAEVQSVLPQYDAIKAKIEGAGGEVDEQLQLNLYKDGIVDPMRKDWKIMQYLLQQIADNTKKQLDGMYNFPEGASFWIPLSAAQMYSQRGAGGGGTGGDLPVQPTTEETIKTITFNPETGLRAWQRELQKEVTTERPYAGMGDLKRLEYLQSGKAPTYDAGLEREGKYQFPRWHTAEQEDMNWIDNINQVVDSMVSGINGLDFGSVNESLNRLPGIVTNFGESVRDFFLNLRGGDTKLDTKLPTTNTNDLRTDISYATVPQTTTVDTTSPLALKLSIESRTQLVVDGRTLANVVKNYVRNDLIRSSGTASSLNLNAVI